MRSNTLAILGLVAASQTLPTGEKRQFLVGDGSVDFCINNDCGGSGLIFTPSPQLPPGFAIPKKRSPQYDGPRTGHGADKGDEGGKGGKPDDPWDPWHSRKPGPKEPPKEPDYPDYPPEKPSEPDYPGKDDDNPDYGEEKPVYDGEKPGYDDEKPDYGYEKPDYGKEKPDYPEHDYQEDDVSREDIVEAQETLLFLQQLVLGVKDPEQKATIQVAIDEAKAFLEEHAGIVDIIADPGVGTILIPEGKVRRSTKPKLDVDELYDVLVKLLESRDPSFPVYMVAEQLVQLLLEEGFEFDPTILGAWARLNPKVKRQDGIFALPGTCALEDIIGLETTLATILLIYGSDPPPSILSLRNAVTAALLFCKNAPDIETELTPEIPVDGGDVVPEEPVEGDISIEEPVEGDIVVEEPDEGSAVSERPTRGAPLEPEDPVDGDEDEEGEIAIEEPEESPLIIEEPAEGSVTIGEGEEGSVEVDEEEDGSFEVNEPDRGSLDLNN